MTGLSLRDAMCMKKKLGFHIFAIVPTLVVWRV